MKKGCTTPFPPPLPPLSKFYFDMFFSLDLRTIFQLYLHGVCICYYSICLTISKEFMPMGLTSEKDLAPRNCDKT